MNRRSFTNCMTFTVLAGALFLLAGSLSAQTTLQQLLGNPGFETGHPAPWSTTPGVIDDLPDDPAHSGLWKAWLCGYGTTHEDQLSQNVTIPSTVTSATLTFWLHIDTAETTKTVAFDTLKVQVRIPGIQATTLATYSNLNHNTGYALQSFNLTAFKGKSIQIYLVGTEDASLQTSFLVDDFALNVH